VDAILNTLKGKISLIYISLVVLIALVGFTGFFNLFRLEKAVDSLMTNNYKSINAAAKMTEAIERQDGAVLMSISVDSGKGMEAFMDDHANFIQWYQVEFNNVTELGEKKLTESIGQQYEKYVKCFSELQENIGYKNKEKALVLYNSTMLPLFGQIKQDLSEISHLNETAMFRSKTEASSKTRTSMYFLLGLSFTAVLGGYAASRHYVNRFLNPLNQLSESISRVKAGELNQHLLVQTNDETGKLALEFNNMTQRLQNYAKSTMGQLMTEKNKSMAIVKSISDPLLVLDMDYRIVLINNACESFFSIVESDIQGKHFLEAIHNGEIFNHITSAVQAGTEQYERIIRLSRENDYYFNVVIAAVKDLESQNTGIIVVFHNVTELKELERVKTDLVATISHEFKTPLTSIMMAASMLSDSSMGMLNTEQQEVVEALKEDGEKLSVLVNELLELSRIESGKAIYQFQSCPVHNIVKASVKEFDSIAARKGVQLSIEQTNKLPPVHADFDKITWVLNNLINNALKYTAAGDTVTVGARLELPDVQIYVKDTGTGIMPEYIGHVFDKFYQVKGGELEVRGTGLGLYVSREIVRAHNGEIWVSSKPGEGSIFTFTLPVMETEVKS
jgi:PAS domain S-box-containing protein